MSLRNTLRAFPTLLRIGFFEAVAYRAEMLIWVLATTMPLIMMALWTAVAREGPVISQSGKAYGGAAFVGYFLSMFIVRQLVSSWAAWEMNMEVRSGALSMRLMRPVNPIFGYMAENLAALPMRLVVAIPVATIALLTVGSASLPRDPLIWAIWCVAMLGGWLITFLANVAIGALSLYMQSSIKVMDVWLALFFVFSGYLFPIDLFPPWLRTASSWLPFRYQMGLPVELMTSVHGRAEALGLLWRQWIFVALFAAGAAALWRNGVKRFQAYGG